MMEFKRVWNIKVIITLLCLAAVSVILFYNEQIQNGTNEIIRYDESYNQKASPGGYRGSEGSRP